MIAAELGNVYAASIYGNFLSNYGNFLDKSDPACWPWFARAALRGCSNVFLSHFSKQVERFFSGSGTATVVFLIGRALRGNVDEEKQLIFGDNYYLLDSWISPTNQAVSFYDAQTQCARLAVDTWTLVSTRLHLIKDMRIYIGKLIWEARFEANYKI